MGAEARLQELQLKLPPAPPALGLYRPLVESGTWAYLSGHGPLGNDGNLLTGRVGEDLDLPAGQQAARQVGLTVLSSLKQHFGTLDACRRLVKVLGFVQCTPDFKEIPQVLNGFSELMRDIFGEDAGVAARSAVGAASLPANMAVEVECIFEIDRPIQPH